MKQSMDFLGDNAHVARSAGPPWPNLPSALEMLLDRPGICPLLGSRTVE